MIQKVRKLLEYLLAEAGGVDVDISEPQNLFVDKKSKLTDEDDEEDEDDKKSENLFKSKVRDGEVIKSRRKMGDMDKIADLGNNADLVKARIKSRTPSANVKRKHSMLVRGRKLDHDR